MQLVPGSRVERWTVDRRVDDPRRVAWVVREADGVAPARLEVLEPGVPDADLLRTGLRTALALRHPNVVALLGVVAVEDGTGLVWEHAEGPTLETWLRSRRPSADEAQAVAIGLVDAVREAHKHGVLHLDLSGSQVYVVRERGTLTARVVGFGVAAAVRDDDLRPGRDGAPAGALAYLAPEQLLRGRDEDPRIDVYALGVLLYELATGRNPFVAEDAFATARNVRLGRPPPPRLLAPDLAEHAEDAILRALATDPRDRFQHVDALRAAWLGEEPPTEPSTSWDEVPVDHSSTAPRPVLPSQRPTVERPTPPPVVPVPPPSSMSAGAEPPAPRRPWFGVLLPVGAAGAALVTAGVVGAVGLVALVLALVVDRPTREPDPPVKLETAPAPVVAPPVVAPSTATVEVTGDAQAVALVAPDGERHPPGEVPAGTYEVRATFAGRGEVKTISLKVAAGEIVLVKCVAAFATCAARR